MNAAQPPGAGRRALPAQSSPPAGSGQVPGATAACQDGPPHVTRAGDYDAILVQGFGGPEGQDEVLPFLRNVTTGRGIPDERLEEVATHYRHYGGVSPISAHDRALRAALEGELAQRGIDLPLYWGNRNWHPFLNDALHQIAAAGHRRVLSVATSAYSSYSSCRQYREDLADALADTGLAGQLQIDKVRPYFDHPGFVRPFIEAVQGGLTEIARAGARRVEVLFATHSIPTVDAQRSGPPAGEVGHVGAQVDTGEHGDGGAQVDTGEQVDTGGHSDGGAYVAQHVAVAEAILDRISAGDGVQMSWQLVFQSRSGPPSQPWLEPDINDAIEQLAATGVDGVVIVPVGFLSDHMEVVWDLDNEAMTTAAQQGLYAVRVGTPGVHREFVSGLVDLFVERLEGTPVAQRPAMTELGPWFDVCRPGCCANPRRGFRPVAAGLLP